MSNENRAPRVVIRCDYNHRDEADELRTKIKKAMEAFEND